MMSSRFALAVALLLALALVPTVLHSYVGFTRADGRTSGAISNELHGRIGVDTHRQAGWVKEVYKSDDFIERRYGTDVTLFVARSYDAKSLYHHPELGVAHGLSYDTTEMVHMPAGAETVPLHVLTGQSGLASYALLYGDAFVERPLQWEFRRAFSLLFGPRSQMTLFFARGPGSTLPKDSTVVQVLLAAIESFKAQRPSSPTQ